MIQLEELKKGIFFHYSHGFIVRSKIENVIKKSDDTFEIAFNGGFVDFYFNKVVKVSKPVNYITDKNILWCYKLLNQHNEYLGYVFKEV